MYVKKETEYQNPLAVEKVIEDIAGGGIIVASELNSSELAEGAIVGKDSDGLFHLCKSAKLYADATATATAYQVEKCHEFKVGNYITSKDVDSCKAYAITAIDTSNDDYDTLTVGTTLGVAMESENDVHLVQVSAQDATGGASALSYTPAGITFGSSDLSNDNPDIAVMVRGTVNESLMPYYVPDAFKTALTARIIFN